MLSFLSHCCHLISVVKKKVTVVNVIFQHLTPLNDQPMKTALDFGANLFLIG